MREARSRHAKTAVTRAGASALALCLVATAGLVAAQRRGGAPSAGPYPLVATAHPPLPNDLSLYWYVPDTAMRPTGSTRADAAAATRLARGVQMVAAGDFAAALPLLSTTGLAGTPLENYASYFTGLAQMGLGRHDEALLVLSLLASKPLDGALRELVPLRMGEAAMALKMPERAEGALAELTEEKLAEPGQVWLLRAQVEEAAGHRDHAVTSYRRLYYDFPLADQAESAPEALSRLQGPGTPSPETVTRALGRAERFFSARRWADARTAYAALTNVVTGDAKNTVALRLAECDHYLRNRRAARTALATFFDDPARGAEARFYHALATKALGDRAGFVQAVRALVAAAPTSQWAEQALNELATYLVTQDQDDEADRVFRQLMRAFPKSPYAERAAWKVGWRAYRSQSFPEAIEVFEAAASNFPRADNRPAWLYWAGRARERLADNVTASARFRLVVLDYQNSYYGRLAAGILKARNESPVQARIGAATPVATIAAVEPTGEIIRTLVGAQMYAEALREVEYARQVQGDSARLQATSAWIRHQQGFALTATERFAALRGAITTMRRAYPQFMAAGGEALPPDVLRVIFPLDYWPLITKYADHYKLDRYLIAALMAQESTFTAEIRSDANAYGLMQVIPGTGRIYAKKLGIAPFSTAMLRQPEVNVQIGTRYFSDLMERFGGAHFALASYNAGEGRVARWTKERPGVPQDEFIDDSPYPETQTYVKRILGTAEDYRFLYGSGLIDPNGSPTVLTLNDAPATAQSARPSTGRTRR
ncbi:MAG TPA: transglycosylase SLT domain-containing protein [Vicinamibacterales bacterium]